MKGAKDDELATRWIQFGVFSPVMRLHSSSNPFNSKEPWRFNDIAEKIMKKYLQLRHRLIPYLYTMNRLASRDGQPLIRPMYYLDPGCDEAYMVPNEYYFGHGAHCRSITEPADKKLLAARNQSLAAGRDCVSTSSMGLHTEADVCSRCGGPLEDNPRIGQGWRYRTRFVRRTYTSTANRGTRSYYFSRVPTGIFVLWEDQGRYNGGTGTKIGSRQSLR